MDTALTRQPVNTGLTGLFACRTGDGYAGHLVKLGISFGKKTGKPPTDIGGNLCHRSDYSSQKPIRRIANHR